jgi:hypothetical protein
MIENSENGKNNKDNTLFKAIKNGTVDSWYYEFKNGHPFLLFEETDIILETREDDKYRWMNDHDIKEIIKLKVKSMYNRKFPNAKRWSLPIF